jgi:hypothetical protein
MTWLANLEFQIEWRLREIIREHGGPIATDHPKVKRLFHNLAAVKKMKGTTYERDHHRFSV